MLYSALLIFFSYSIMSIYSAWVLVSYWYSRKIDIEKHGKGLLVTYLFFIPVFFTSCTNHAKEGDEIFENNLKIIRENNLNEKYEECVMNQKKLGDWGCARRVVQTMQQLKGTK